MTGRHLRRRAGSASHRSRFATLRRRGDRRDRARRQGARDPAHHGALPPRRAGRPPSGGRACPRIPRSLLPGRPQPPRSDRRRDRARARVSAAVATNPNSASRLSARCTASRPRCRGRRSALSPPTRRSARLGELKALELARGPDGRRRPRLGTCGPKAQTATRELRRHRRLVLGGLARQRRESVDLMSVATCTLPAAALHGVGQRTARRPSTRSRLYRRLRRGAGRRAAIPRRALAVGSPRADLNPVTALIGRAIVQPHAPPVERAPCNGRRSVLAPSPARGALVHESQCNELLANRG